MEAPEEPAAARVCTEAGYSKQATLALQLLKRVQQPTHRYSVAAKPIGAQLLDLYGQLRVCVLLTFQSLCLVLSSESKDPSRLPRQ